jgi:hypothetical protein
MATMVELRGRLSNPDERQLVRDVRAVMDGKVAQVASSEQAATYSVRIAPQPVRARLGDEAVAELVAAFVAGTTCQELSDRYGVSLSSVKRLLRGSGTRRLGGSAAGESGE